MYIIVSRVALILGVTHKRSNLESSHAVTENVAWISFSKGLKQGWTKWQIQMAAKLHFSVAPAYVAGWAASPGPGPGLGRGSWDSENMGLGWIRTEPRSTPCMPLLTELSLITGACGQRIVALP